MPCLVTHNYFAQDVIDNLKLDKKIKNILNNNIKDLSIFAQSTDPILSYNIFYFGLGKSIRKNYQKTMHKKHTQKLLLSLIKYTKTNNLTKNSQIINLIYGYICHYVLDSTIHPYIIYKSGVFSKKNKSSYKYNGNHADLEVFLDCYMIYTRERVLPQNFKIYQIYNKNFSLNDATSKMLDKIAFDIYGYKNFSKTYQKAIKHMNILDRWFRYDKYGIKRKIYKCIDFISPNNFVKKEQLSYNNNFEKKMYYLNLDKKEWNNPVDKNEKYNYSIIELYKIALNRCISIIENVNLVLYSDKDIHFLEEYIKNISYRTGKDSKDKREIKHFEY